MSEPEIAEKDALHAAHKGKGPEAGSWWKRLTKDNGLNGMDAIPKGRQGDSSDEEEEDTRIPKDVRTKEKRIVKEKNGGKKPEKHAEKKECEIPEMCPDDAQSPKQQAEAAVKNVKEEKKEEVKEEKKEEKKEEEKKEEKKEDAKVDELQAAIGLSSSKSFPLNSNGLPMHFNESVGGDNFFGKS